MPERHWTILIGCDNTNVRRAQSVEKFARLQALKDREAENGAGRRPHRFGIERAHGFPQSDNRRSAQGLGAAYHDPDVTRVLDTTADEENRVAPGEQGVEVVGPQLDQGRNSLRCLRLGYLLEQTLRDRKSV